MVFERHLLPTSTKPVLPMAASSAVNNTFSGGTHILSEPERPSITSRPGALAQEPLSTDSNRAESSLNTPTRHSFGGVLGQRPLPDGPFASTNKTHDSAIIDVPNRSDRENGVAKLLSDVDSQDVDMGDGEDDGVLDDDDGSGNESVTSETQRPSKKKKGQRFFCTEFPPCQLSFTRSEHLARHIRKHTGERPFQCHCSRRFSRLDNLRQHAQTVHVNEEIPGDSLAAQSTRFQRQIRTDRVRPTSSRSRASTIGSQGGHSKGHSRNLSASSIGSTTSSIGVPEDSRRRPQPLAMANDGSARARLTIETFANVGASPAPQYAYYNPSSTGYSTPTSTTFSPGNGSPQFQSAIVSPSSSISRSSFYNGTRSHARRLSVPSTQNPFHNHGGTYPPPYFGPVISGSSSTFSPTAQVFASPTSSVFSHSRRDSETEMDHRRRTWHPSTNSQYTQRPATSGLTYHQTPDEPRPAFSQQPAASQMTRLPGIESFDHAPPPASRQPSSPMMLNATPRPLSSGRAMDAGLQQGLTRLDIASANAPSDGYWPAPPHASHVSGNSYGQQDSGARVQYVQPQHVSMPEQPVTPRKYKRNAWYGGPVNPPSVLPSSGSVLVRTSPEDSGSSDGVATPSVSHLTEFYPVIVNHAGVPETYSTANVMPEEQKPFNNSADHPPKAEPMRSDSGFHGLPQDHPQQQSTPTQQTYTLQAGHDPRLSHPHYNRPPSNDMAKLEALVAVATSQSRAVEHQS